jgi:hypothetical protein
MRTFLIVLTVLFLFIGLAVFETCGHVAGSITNSITGVIDKTVDPDNIIYNYEYFKQAYQDIRALDKQIVDADVAVSNFNGQFKNRKEMDRDDKTESDRLNSVALGLKQERQNEIATYNARSQMANRTIFQTHDLPSHIE